MKLTGVAKSRTTLETTKITPLEVITHYNNFYEFGTAKDDPAE